MNRKMATDDNLRVRGFITVSVCPLCYTSDETADYILLTCKFSCILWNWLSYVLNHSISTISIASLFSICDIFCS